MTSQDRAATHAAVTPSVPITTFASHGYTCEGKVVRIRPITASDLERERAFISDLSPASRYQRILSSRNKLLPGELERFTHIDYDREMALVATVGHDGAEQQIGVARYIKEDAGKSAECAIVIADAWQGKGLGECLFRNLISVAKLNRVERLTGITLSTNEPMISLARQLGFRVEWAKGEALISTITKDL
jgi:acetyltransferase